MKDDRNSPIFVTGVERSGNSIIARIISMAGAFTGETTPMYENKEIKKFFEDYYKSIVAAGTILGQYPLADVSDMLIPINWKEKVMNLIIQDGYQDGAWMYKSTKICQLWPIWHFAFPDAKWIIVRRRTGDIIQSCCKTAYMKAFFDPAVQKSIGIDTPRDGWLWWVRQHEDRFVEMIQTGVNCKVIWPERMVDGNYQQIYEMLEWLGLDWNDEIVTKITPLLKKSRR